MAKIKAWLCLLWKQFPKVCCEYTLAHLAPDGSLILVVKTYRAVSNLYNQIWYASDNMTRRLVKYLDISGDLPFGYANIVRYARKVSPNWIEISLVNKS